jgi:hypothetical protein
VPRAANGYVALEDFVNAIDEQTPEDSMKLSQKTSTRTWVLRAPGACFSLVQHVLRLQ